MRTFFTLFIAISFSLNSFCQSLCQTVNENQTLTLTAPAGMVFVSVTFASYGTPNGSCGSFTISGCHATNSQSIVEAALLGKNSGSIAATNAVFGDPCNGTVKKLSVEAVYSAITPLQLLNLSGAAIGEHNILQWQTVNEVNTKEFVIERSLNGIQFTAIGVVKSNNRVETNNYSYTDDLFTNETSFYRLKMTDIDGSFKYSKIVSIKNKAQGQLQILPNPVTRMLTLNHLKSGWIELINLQGRVLQKIQVKNQTLHLDLADYPTGIYFVRYLGAKGIEIHKILKQ